MKKLPRKHSPVTGPHYSSSDLQEAVRNSSKETREEIAQWIQEQGKNSDIDTIKSTSKDWALSIYNGEYRK